MRCPSCHSLSSRVVDSRLTPRDDATRRRRECEDCGNRFTTYERVELAPILVVKKGGDRERFDREKLRAGLDVALHRRPVGAEAIEEFLRNVEQRIAERPGAEVNSSELGDWVMAFLRSVDTIAYVRFASVYRAFEDIGELLDEVAALAREDAAGDAARDTEDVD
ncbi:MAG: transcriptional repressor NrdR [Deltaproteobacteria bacterium]|nr:transcriptional repressor NrdR [Deltaproteobacteria bacterium]